ncbi:catabolite control protein A [Weissella muntiaci]|uniref:Catabolite control protein A n=1 Tax=Weissella muntiaci TaxID=2508881 RepID=A0A6C2C805_9LACO|nr:catabolite control protein A [Weissella muntiaci]TYC50054.1 catabolite control protein A [Weissella muntiaci]
MDKQTVTIYDVAREAKVSMATVSRVVNGNANVKQETKEKVEEVIKRLGYRPNAVARGLASRRTTTIGVVIPDVTDDYFAELARGIDDVAQMYHYHIILANSDEAGTKEAQVIDNLLSKQVDGVIFMGNMISDAVREEMVRADVPFVLAGTVDRTGVQPSVNIDYVSAIDEATARLIKAGHKNISFISGPLTDEINSEYKLMGYKNALTVAGYDYDPALVLSTGYDYQSGYKLADQVRNTSATAAIVVSDEMAAGVLNGLTDAGVRVPEEFEIITNNDSKLATITRPQLSSITQPMYDLGAVAMRMLTKMMEREELAVKSVILPHGYVERDSTKG